MKTNVTHSVQRLVIKISYIVFSDPGSDSRFCDRFVPATNTDDCFVMDKSHNSATRLAQLRPGLIIEPGISPSTIILLYSYCTPAFYEFAGKQNFGNVTIESWQIVTIPGFRIRKGRIQVLKRGAQQINRKQTNATYHQFFKSMLYPLCRIDYFKTRLTSFLLLK